MNHQNIPVRQYAMPAINSGYFGPLHDHKSSSTGTVNVLTEFRQVCHSPFPRLRDLYMIRLLTRVNQVVISSGFKTIL
jgi:hypothetical protein